MINEEKAFIVKLADESETQILGRKLAERSLAGDAILLKGDLGMGKTVLARGFVRHLIGEEEEVPSPTFTLCQPYFGEKLSVWHFDFYRLERPEDVLELGLEEALSEGVALIEWPERLGAFLPEKGLMVELFPDPEGLGRIARLSFGSDWAERLAGGVE